MTADPVLTVGVSASSLSTASRCRFFASSAAVLFCASVLVSVTAQAYGNCERGKGDRGDRGKETGEGTVTERGRPTAPVSRRSIGGADVEAGTLPSRVVACLLSGAGLRDR